MDRQRSRYIDDLASNDGSELKVRAEDIGRNVSK